MTRFAAVGAAALAVAAVAQAGSVIYSDLYNHFNSASSLVKDGQAASDDVASWAYAANSADGFGGIATFSQSSPYALSTGSVIMSNWFGWNPSGGPGVATPSYEHEFTLELYQVDRSGALPTVGSLIAAVTETQTVAGRQLPSASNASFADRGGTDFLMTFDLSGITVASEVLFMLSFDIPDGDPNADNLRSLNIAAVSSSATPDVTAGVSNGNEVFWRSDSFTGGEIQRFEGGRVFSEFTGQIIPLPSPALLTAAGFAGVAARRRRR